MARGRRWKWGWWAAGGAVVVGGGIAGIAALRNAGVKSTSSGGSGGAAAGAVFDFGESSLGSVTAAAGATVTATVPVTNKGGTAGTPTFSGGLSAGGTQVATWQAAGTVPSVAPGQSASVALQLTVPSDLPAATDPVTLTVSP